jgi:hypothetical protein
VVTDSIGNVEPVSAETVDVGLTPEDPLSAVTDGLASGVIDGLAPDVVDGPVEGVLQLTARTGKRTVEIYLYNVFIPFSCWCHISAVNTVTDGAGRHTIL